MGVKRLKFTVPYEGTYFDGGKLFGAAIIYAENAEKAQEKLQKTFDERGDEPITYAGKAYLWSSDDHIGEEIYPYWQ